jgi:hypothetical protein
MHAAAHDPVPLHLSKLLNQHLFHSGNRASQLGKAQDVTVCFCLPFGKNLTFSCVLAMR